MTICDLGIIDFNGIRENGDNKPKRIEELEREVKFWQDRYNELYTFKLLGCPGKIRSIWVNKLVLLFRLR